MTRPPFWRDVRVVRVALQVGFLLAVGAFLFTIYRNLVDNLEAQGIRTDFSYLDGPAGFPILGSSFKPAQPIREALLVGMQNTAAVAVLGMVLCTLLGTLLGIARLSSNWIVRKMAAVYVETIRNIPPLLVILFVFLSVVLQFPRVDESITASNLVILNVKGVTVASVVAGGRAGSFYIGAAVAIASMLAVMVWRTRRGARTGEPHRRWRWGLGVLAFGLTIAWFVTGSPLSLSRPRIEGLGVEGGLAMTGSYFALAIALSVYTSSHIAEIVRGSIQAVPKGQTEAAQAIALGSFQRMRFVVLPQAFRIATPAMINQYLNLTKNTSLGIAISYAEVTAVSKVAIGNGAPAPQSILVLMAIYLTFSFVISGLSNIVNRRLQIVEQ